MKKHVQAGCVLSGVGSLRHASLRLADRDSTSEYDGPFEIVSITGTLSTHGSHLHISIADSDGRTIGGHFESGCTIYTTAEIVIAVFEDVIYKREFAEDSGYEELAVYSAKPTSPGHAER
jgi:predicted DNA-binding protein with PD1-like motif